MIDWHRKVYKKPKEKLTIVQREQWRALRKAVLIRDKNTCFRCQKDSKSGKGMTVHHIQPRSDGGSNEMENLITLCNPCHDYVECEGFTTLDEIAASAEDEIIPVPDKGEKIKVETFERPAWHARVYGGQR